MKRGMTKEQPEKKMRKFHLTNGKVNLLVERYVVHDIFLENDTNGNDSLVSKLRICHWCWNDDIYPEYLQCAIGWSSRHMTIICSVYLFTFYFKETICLLPSCHSHWPFAGWTTAGATTTTTTERKRNNRVFRKERKWSNIWSKGQIDV